MRSIQLAALLELAAIAVLATGCADSRPPTRDKNTNWLQPCSTASACTSGLECLGGVCTRACERDTDCSETRADLICANSVCAQAASVRLDGGPAQGGSGGIGPAPAGSGPAPAGSGPGADAGTGDPAVCERPEVSRAPGPAHYDAAATGRGPCASTPLSDVIAAIHAAYPDVAEIGYVYNPDSPPPPSGGIAFIYAYDTEDGYALAFQSGSGDCEAGCIEREYWYFRADAECTPLQVGHYVQMAGSPCDAEGFPLWDHPVPPALPATCNPHRLPTEATLRGCGEGNVCAFGGGKSEPVELELELAILEVSPLANPTLAMFSLTGTGRELLDGRLLTGTVDGRKLAISTTVELPSTCLEQFSIEAVFDFDGAQPSFLRYEESRTPDCTSSSGDYCKGQLQLDFGSLLPESACLPEFDITAEVERARARHLSCTADADCAAVQLETDCTGGCARAVRADHAAELEALIAAAGAAHCQGATCGSFADCALVEPACQEGRCVLEQVTP